LLIAIFLYKPAVVKEACASLPAVVKEACASFLLVLNLSSAVVDMLVFHLSILHVVKELSEFGMVKPWSKDFLASGGAIFLCNHLTKKECFEKKIFGLSPNYAEFVEKVKAGTTLFLFDIDQHKLHGVFEATSDGALDIIPHAFSARQRFPYQARILSDL
jgi:hypothetical protein